MTKGELTGVMSKDLHLTKAQAEALLLRLAEAVRAELRLSGSFTLPGVGKFKAKVRAARTGRNPQSGEPLAIPAKTAVTFKATAELLAGLQ